MAQTPLISKKMPMVTKPLISDEEAQKGRGILQKPWGYALRRFGNIPTTLSERRFVHETQG